MCYRTSWVRQFFIANSQSAIQTSGSAERHKMPPKSPAKSPAPKKGGAKTAPSSPAKGGKGSPKKKKAVGTARAAEKEEVSDGSRWQW